MRRGEVWWATLPQPAGRRPVLLLSRDVVYRVRKSATVAPLTRTIRDIPTEVPVDRTDGIPRKSVVSLDDLVTLPLAVLTRCITTLSVARMREVDAAIRYALDVS